MSSARGTEKREKKKCTAAANDDDVWCSFVVVGILRS